MTPHQTVGTIPGWTGGFAGSDPDYAYPEPNLTSLPMLGNMENIDLLQRQQKVIWPEFSWETIPGDPKSRCFQMFAPDISRFGYTDDGRVYSIICPQQGACSPSLGSLNVEVTVTGQRGWIDEPTQTLAADMTVTGVIWFSPSAHANPLVKLLWRIFERKQLKFPFSKANAIKVKTHRLRDPAQPVFPVRTGETTLFESPKFAQHSEDAWAVGNIAVEIGPLAKTGHAAVDEFNQMIIDVFNMSTGNMLKAGNLLTWNLWMTAPELVDQAEWHDHARKWRESIDADHGSPEGDGTDARYFDGSPFKPVESLMDAEIEKIHAYLERHHSRVFESA